MKPNSMYGWKGGDRPSVSLPEMRMPPNLPDRTAFFDSIVAPYLNAQRNLLAKGDIRVGIPAGPSTPHRGGVMYRSSNIGNFSPRIKLNFVGFRERPYRAAFTVERFDEGVMRVAEVLHVPIRRKPTTRRGYHKTRRWAWRRALEALVGWR